MLKQFLLYTLFLVLLASCSSLKTAFTSNKQSQNTAQVSENKKDPKFLNQIDVPVETAAVTPTKAKTVKHTIPEKSKTEKKPVFETSETENISELQVKYAVLLNTPAEEVRNTKMFEFIDEWYGTPYKLGGDTKKGIDCSAFSQFLFASVYGFSIPRTAREQYRATSRISRTELKEGDLIFFNTRGGVSHVGVYLQNNKFVHASTSGGVMISDIFDEYWVRRFVGVGRLIEKEDIASGK